MNDDQPRREKWLERTLEPPENSLVRKMLNEWTLYKGTFTLLWRISYWAFGIIVGIYMARDVINKIVKALFL